MTSRLLLDTHVLIRWLAEPQRLSRDQKRMLSDAVRQRQSLAISAMSLIELALLFDKGLIRRKLNLEQLIDELETNPIFTILPLIEVAKEISSVGALSDPADRVIAATARVHGLRLLTSDQRIIAANLVSAIE